jgi:hypothetical protein
MVTEPQDEGRQDQGWEGQNPFFLCIVEAPTAVTRTARQNIIDLDHPGWVASNADIMRAPGVWMLFHKAAPSQPVVIIWVNEGEQPYYTQRHVGLTGSGGSNEVSAYGIGKKGVDGAMTRLWVLPDGSVCGGDDVDTIGIRMVQSMGPRGVTM